MFFSSREKERGSLCEKKNSTIYIFENCKLILRCRFQNGFHYRQVLRRSFLCCAQYARCNISITARAREEGSIVSRTDASSLKKHLTERHHAREWRRRICTCVTQLSHVSPVNLYIEHTGTQPDASSRQ